MNSSTSIIIKSSARGGAVELAAHLVSDENEAVRIVEVRGIEKENLRNMLRQMELMGAGSRSRRPLDHASINPAPGINLNDRQVVDAFSIYDRTHGLPEDTPTVILCHQKRGRTHYHQVSLRIDMLRMVAAPDGWRYRRNEETARQIESAFGLEQGKGRFSGRTRIDGHVVDARPVCYLTHAEHQQAKRLHIDQSEIDMDIQSAWDQSDCGEAFAAALKSKGYAIARGDRRDVVIVDPSGGVHSPRRRLKDGGGRRLKAAAVKARLDDLDLARLRSLEDVKRDQHNKPSPAVSLEAAHLRALATVVAEKRPRIELLGRIRRERQVLAAESAALRSIAAARAKHMARMQQARKRRLARLEEIRGDAAKNRRALEDLAHRLADAEEARLRRDSQRLDETNRRFESLHNRKKAIRPEWESIRKAPDAAVRKTAVALPMAPLDYASNVKWHMLSSYYATDFDRHAAPFIRFVNIPSDRNIPLAVDLKSKETLLDYGDEIRLDRCGGVSQDAVTVLVSMVKAHGWSSVILRGSDQFIASASQALENEGISWRAGCEQDDPSAPQLPVPPLAPRSLPLTFDDDIKEIDAMLDQCDRYERYNDDINAFRDVEVDNTRSPYHEDHFLYMTSEATNSADKYSDKQIDFIDEEDVNLGDEFDVGRENENVKPIFSPATTAEFPPPEGLWDLGDDLGIDPFEPVRIESEPMLDSASATPLEDLWGLGDDLGSDPFEPGDNGAMPMVRVGLHKDERTQQPKAIASDVACPSGRRRGSPSQEPDGYSWYVPASAAARPTDPPILPADNDPPLVNGVPPTAPPRGETDRIPEVTAYRHVLAALVVDGISGGSQRVSVEALRSARVAVARIHPQLDRAMIEKRLEATVDDVWVSLHRKVLGWEGAIENFDRYKATLHQRRQLEPGVQESPMNRQTPPKSGGGRRFKGRDRED